MVLRSTHNTNLRASGTDAAYIDLHRTPGHWFESAAPQVHQPLAKIVGLLVGGVHHDACAPQSPARTVGGTAGSQGSARSSASAWALGNSQPPSQLKTRSLGTGNFKADGQAHWQADVHTGPAVIAPTYH